MQDIDGLIGIDFKNAFALTCRKCVNSISGVNLIADEVNFFVKSNNQQSKNFCSIIGTGAGRPSGGPGFNCAFHCVLCEGVIMKVIEPINFIAYADDSQIKTKIEVPKVLAILNSFQQMKNIGMFMHSVG